MSRLVALSLLVVLAGCAERTACTTFASSGSARGSRRSTFRASGCTDGRTYAVSCVAPHASGIYRCSCEVGGHRQTEFSRPDPLPHTSSAPRLALTQVNTGCGWRLSE